MSNETLVTAIKTFGHGNEIKTPRSASFHVPEHLAVQYVAKGLVVRGIPAPMQVVGEKLSASPAAPALPEQTAMPSRRGGRRKKAEASLSSTPVSE